MTTKINHKAAQDFLVLLFEMKLMSKDLFKVRLQWFEADLVKLFPLSCRMQRD